MKLFIKKVMLFMIFFFFAYPVLVLFTGCFVPKLFKPNISYQIGAYGHMFSRLREIKKVNGDVDVLFLGSSHAYRGFDVRNFKELKAFNLGSSAQTPMQTNVLLNRYLDKILPKTIVYEVYPETFSSDGAEASLDLISNDKNDIYSLRLALHINNIKVYNTFLFGFFCDLFNINAKYSEGEVKGEDKYVSGGFVEREIRYYSRHVKHGLTKAVFNVDQMRAFEEIVSKIKARKSRLILVYAPITHALYKSYTNQPYVDSVMNSYNLEYYNYNTILSLDDSLDFYDAHHLNQHGVNKFNASLYQLLTD